MQLSIITATFNSAYTVQNALNSVSDQTYSNIEHLIIDGASNDNTLEIVNKYTSQQKQIVSEPDMGVYDALNKGLKLAKGEIIGFLHSDDEFASAGTIERITKAFHNPEIDVVYGDLQYINHKGELIRHWRSKPFEPFLLAKGWMPPHPTVFMRREVYEKHQLFDLQYRISADYDYMLRVFTDKTLNVHYIPTVITKMRIGGMSNRNLKNILNKSLEDYQIIKKHKLSHPIWLLIQKNLSKLTQFYVR